MARKPTMVLPASMQKPARQRIKGARAFEGGQQYPVTLKGGTLLDGGITLYQNLFNPSKDTRSATLVDYLGELVSSDISDGKIGNGELLTTQYYGVRIWKRGAVAMTPDQMHAAIKLLASSTIRFFIGSNNTKVLDVELCHFLPAIGGIASSGSENAGDNVTAWLPLDELTAALLTENSTIKAELEVGLNGGTPTDLAFSGTDPNFVPEFVFNFIVGARKEVEG